MRGHLLLDLEQRDHGGHPRLIKTDNLHRLLDGREDEAVYGGVRCQPRWSTHALPSRHLPQGAGEPSRWDPPAERRGRRRGHSPVGERLQNRQPRGRAAGAAGQPRPGHRGPGAWPGDGEDWALLPADSGVQHHRERHDHHAARAADGEALPEPQQLRGAPRARYDLPAPGTSSGADSQGDLTDQHHGRVQGELQQHHVLRLGHDRLLAGQLWAWTSTARSEPLTRRKLSRLLDPPNSHGEGLVPPAMNLGLPDLVAKYNTNNGSPKEFSPSPVHALPENGLPTPRALSAFSCPNCGSWGVGRRGLPAEGALRFKINPDGNGQEAYAQAATGHILQFH